ncbi:MAG: hypothetical protein AABX29_08695 [Nanoarchaeota archaeon]
MKCEACRKSNVQAELIIGGITYKICMNCLLPFVAHALTPEQFNNMLISSHKKTDFMLHDDFYDDDGHALQPAF